MRVVGFKPTSKKDALRDVQREKCGVIVTIPRLTLHPYAPALCSLLPLFSQTDTKRRKDSARRLAVSFFGSCLSASS